MADEDTIDVDGVAIPIASKRTLIRRPKETVRPSDLADRVFLQGLIDEERRGQHSSDVPDHD